MNVVIIDLAQQTLKLTNGLRIFQQRYLPLEGAVTFEYDVTRTCCFVGHLREIINILRDHVLKCLSNEPGSACRRRRVWASAMTFCVTGEFLSCASRS